MKLTDELVEKLQTDLILRVLPKAIQTLCQNPEGIIAELLLENEQGKNPNAISLLQKLDDGLYWFGDIANDQWLSHALLECCGQSTSKTIEQQKSLLAEVSAYLQLSFCFADYRKVAQVPEQGGTNGKTPDFKLGNDFYVEVYCPDESKDHKDAVKALENTAREPDGAYLKIILSHPVTGNKPIPTKYASNQTLTRVISDKRDKDQTVPNAVNVLWLNFAIKLNLDVKTLLPIRSASKGKENTIGANGIWHSFYGEKDNSVFAFSGHSLRVPNNSSNYQQKDHSGLFRDRPSLSAAIIESTDGVVLFQNPWANIVLDKDDVKLLCRIYAFRPEYSWFDVSTPGSLEEKIQAELDTHKFLLRSKEQP